MENTGTVKSNGMVTQAEAMALFSNKSDSKTNNNVLNANSVDGTPSSYAVEPATVPTENLLNQGDTNRSGIQLINLLTDLIQNIINLILNLIKPFGAAPSSTPADPSFAAAAEPSADDGDLPSGISGTSDNVNPGEDGQNSGDLNTTGSSPAINSNDDGRIWGDPHYVGADGGKFDFMGKQGGTYNVLSDKNFQYNARYAPWGNQGATVTGAVGFQFANKDGSVDRVSWERQKWVDGKPCKINQPPQFNGQAMQKGKTYYLEGGQVLWNGTNLKVTSYSRDTNGNVIEDADGPRKEYEIKVISKDQYFNQEIKAGDTWSDGVDPHGLWGQTIDADTTARNGQGKQGKGALDIVENGQTRLSTAADADETIINQYQVSDQYGLEDLFSTTTADENGQAFVKFTDN